MTEERVWLKKQFKLEGNKDVEKIMKEQDEHFKRFNKYFIPNRMIKKYIKKFN